MQAKSLLLRQLGVGSKVEDEPSQESAIDGIPPVTIQGPKPR